MFSSGSSLIEATDDVESKRRTEGLFELELEFNGLALRRLCGLEPSSFMDVLAVESVPSEFFFRLKTGPTACIYIGK